MTALLDGHIGCFDDYMKNSREGIWRIDLIPPLELDASVDQQVSTAFQNSIMGEANDAIARQYGFTNTEELIGRRLCDFLSQSDPKMCRQ